MTVDLDELERLEAAARAYVEMRDRVLSGLRQYDDDYDCTLADFRELYDEDLVADIARELRAYRTVTSDQPYLQDRVRREMER